MASSSRRPRAWVLLRCGATTPSCQWTTSWLALLKLLWEYVHNLILVSYRGFFFLFKILPKMWLIHALYWHLLFPFCTTVAPRPGRSRELRPIQVAVHADTVQRPDLLPGATLTALPAQPSPEKLEGTAVSFLSSLNKNHSMSRMSVVWDVSNSFI